MSRFVVDRRLAWLVPALLALAVVVVLFRTETRVRQRVEPQVRAEPERQPAVLPPAVALPQAPRTNGGVPPRARIEPPKAPPGSTAPTEIYPDNRVIHGMTPEERRAKGITVMRLYASRSGARFGFMATMLEREGFGELAQSLTDLGKQFLTARQLENENEVGWGDLLSRQNELMHEVVRVLLDDDVGKDNPFLRAIAARSVDDVDAAMAGDLESVDRKLEEELDENREKDEPDEAKGGDEEPEPEENTAPAGEVESADGQAAPKTRAPSAH